MPDLGKENTFQKCVSEMALAGFTGSEVGGKYPTDVETLKKALDLRGIQICNCWFSSFLISRPYEETEKEFISQNRLISRRLRSLKKGFQRVSVPEEGSYALLHFPLLSVKQRI